MAAIGAHITGSAAGSGLSPDGTFEMKDVSSGEYHLRVHSGEPTTFFAADRIVVVNGSAPVVAIEVELSFSVGSVEGRAIETGGNPTARTEVVLQSADPGKLRDARYRHVHGAVRAYLGGGPAS